MAITGQARLPKCTNGLNYRHRAWLIARAHQNLLDDSAFSNQTLCFQSMTNTGQLVPLRTSKATLRTTILLVSGIPTLRLPPAAAAAAHGKQGYNTHSQLNGERIRSS